MTAELIGALAVILAAIITGLFQRLRRENNGAHKETSEKLDEIVGGIESIDEQLDDITEWQEGHQAYHDRKARTPR
ncbi:MAG: hypothetical protein CMA52_03205 [Euryarchaeota archaeon]|jgi:hypothetical protein|nr:hypothetical protein [Euryarchaeota archaeon]|tara:strand:+ start:659 stop:886 length:228 start_codon:yes stop_codon:yes gene_type:complete